MIATPPLPALCTRPPPTERVKRGNLRQGRRRRLEPITITLARNTHMYIFPYIIQIVVTVSLQPAQLRKRCVREYLLPFRRPKVNTRLEL